MPEQDVILSTQATETQLTSLHPHLQLFNSWADNHFHTFPNVSTISATFGVAFGLQFTVTLTWQRKKTDL